MQTDNSHFAEKVQLRLDNLPDKETIHVLDAYHGNGLLWREIAGRRPDVKFGVVGIDVKRERRGLYLMGDNRKFIAGMDLSRFDVIDLDAYGAPFEQVEMVLTRPGMAGKIIFVTWIQSMFGMPPKRLLVMLGYTRAMIDAIPSLFCRHGIDKFLDYLALRGIGHIKLYQDASGRKNYLCFRIKN